jgi:hypothetical protein
MMLQLHSTEDSSSRRYGLPSTARLHEHLDKPEFLSMDGLPPSALMSWIGKMHDQGSGGGQVDELMGYEWMTQQEGASDSL